jgi:hypothetical protein
MIQKDLLEKEKVKSVYALKIIYFNGNYIIFFFNKIRLNKLKFLLFYIKFRLI